MVAFNVPGLLIPYPYAMNNHQEKNGAVISKKIGGAVMLKESELQNNFLKLLNHILGKQMEVCLAMKQALKASNMRHGRSLIELIEEEL
jgi:UDP-N-acetylglucosamine--N-acetylmuramyl-(pentapeptide) pyrophosphoryl-undecaprenol N-acetylglucosamine transferase